MEDSLILQNQIRENSDDLQSFLRDMDHWEKDMRKKEAELKLMNISDEQECPPIRNSSSRNKKKNRHKKKKDKSVSSPTKETPNDSKLRISSYNYKAWEKFDVDSELKKIDDTKKESSASESSDEEEEEEMSVQSKRQLAIIKKDNGNKFFKAGNYDSAINCYTLGMELDPENALLPANRAQALLKKEQFQAAENDCTLCLSLDPTFPKAYMRRGYARAALQKFFLAKSDFLKVLEMEPKNKQAQLELEKINMEIIKESQTFKSIDMEATQEIIPLEQNVLNVEVMEIVEEIKDDNTEHKSSSTSARADRPNEESDTMNLCNGIENVVLSLEQMLPPVPTASFQFLTDWKKISRFPELQYSYLKQITPDIIQVLFKNYIEPELFPEIIHTLSTSFIENGDDVCHYLKALSTVGRFNTMLMFLSQGEIEDLKKLKSYLEISSYDSSQVAALMQLYGV